MLRWRGGEAGGISIPVKKKKASSVVWLNTYGLEAQAEGGKTPKLNSISNKASHPCVD